MVIALHTWHTHLENALLLVFLDNEAAKESLVKGASPTPSMRMLSAEFWRLAMTVRVLPWFERVASKSNVIDRVSRPGQYERPDADDRGVPIVWDRPVFPPKWAVPPWVSDE